MPDQYIVAIIGLAGAVIGSFTTIAGNLLMNYVQERAKQRVHESRRKLLETMLRHPEHTWRKLDTLSHVVGSDRETTVTLLLEIGARGSEDGKDLWGLIERNPLKNVSDGVS